MISNKHVYQVGFLILIVSSFLSHIQPVAGGGNGNYADSTKSSNVSNEDTNHDQRHAVNYELISLFNVIVSTVGVLSNALLIMAIIIDPLRTLRKGAWLTILNLAFADLLTTAAAIILYSIPRLQIKLSHRLLWNFIFEVVLNSGYSASFFFLTLWNMEVFVITKYPLHCKSILTKTKVRIACALAWLMGTAMGCLAFVKQFELCMKLLVAWIGILELAVLIQVIFKILIIMAIVKGRKSLSNSYKSGKHNNVAKTVIILNAVLMLTAFPYFISLQIWYVSRLGVIDIPVFMNQFAQYYFPVGLINGVVNPFVYAWRLPDYRRTLLACLRKRRSSSRSSGKGTLLSYGNEKTTTAGLSRKKSSTLLSF